MNKTQNKKTTQKINTTKSWFFEKINEVEKPLATLTKEKREKTHINKIINEREITTDITHIYIQRIWNTMKEYMPTNSIN